MSGAVSTVEIKICGITRVEDALAAVDVGAAMLGLNFYAAKSALPHPGASSGGRVRRSRRQRPEGQLWARTHREARTSEAGRCIRKYEYIGSAAHRPGRAARCGAVAWR